MPSVFLPHRKIKYLKETAINAKMHPSLEPKAACTMNIFFAVQFRKRRRADSASPAGRGPGCPASEAKLARLSGTPTVVPRPRPISVQLHGRINSRPGDDSDDPGRASVRTHRAPLRRAPGQTPPACAQGLRHVRARPTRAGAGPRRATRARTPPRLRPLHS